jgi:RNA polymerase sigma-70 factor (ECF subfamily)
MNASSSPPGSQSESDGKSDYFATTRWTVVLKAGRKSSLDSDAALAELCRTYWYPLYVYVRRRGQSKEDAEDLVQGFFERFLAKNYLENVAADRGKFRAFLLASLKHYMSNEWDRASRQKRGGGVEMLSLDWVNAADRFQLEPEDSTHPEREYDRVWALALLGRVVQELRAECESEGKVELFDCAKGFLTATSESPSYELAGKALGLESGAVRVAVHRLRKRYRELLKRELMQTLSNPSDLAEELRALLTAVS